MEHEQAVFGGGCFWCLEALFKELRGVTEVTSGYCGGVTAHPDYEQVCSGTSGHAEVVRIIFKPAEITFTNLLEVFFASHDPTTRDRQGHDVGSQYRSIVVCQDDTQRLTCQRVIAELNAAKLWLSPVVTEITGPQVFYAAEKYHQDYYKLNQGQPYCTAVIGPKLAKFRKMFADRR